MAEQKNDKSAQSPQAAEREAQQRATRATADVDLSKLGESSDPEVHQLLGELEVLQQQRQAAAPEPDLEAVAVIDQKIEAVYHRIRNLNKPETAKLREQRAAAAAKGDAAEVARIDAKLDGK